MEFFVFGVDFLLYGHTGGGTKMVYDMGSSSMDQIQSNDRPVWDMLLGDVAQRLAAGKWRNHDRNERTKGSETPL